MLFFFSVRVNPKEMSLDDLWNLWDREAESAVAAKEAGKIVSLYTYYVGAILYGCPNCFMRIPNEFLKHGQHVFLAIKSTTNLEINEFYSFSNKIRCT